MAIGISLWFDDLLESRVRELWRELAVLGISTMFHEGPYRPHVTLGVWDRMDVERLVPVLRDAARAWPRVPIRLNSVGAFPSEEGTTFLKPATSASLTSLHGAVHSLVAPFAAGPSAYYVEGAWTPHCSMGSHVPRAQVLRAVDLLLSSGLPLEGEASAIGVIDTPAEVELHRVELAG